MNRTLKTHRNPAWTALVSAAVLVLALAPAAGAADVAEVRASSRGLDFQPMVEHGALVLTVSGPDGFDHRAEFKAGESPAFSIFDQGGVLSDGSYNWELRVVPSETQKREAFEANQSAGRGRGGMEALVQSGSFAILGGAVVYGNETEPGAGRSGRGGPSLAEKVQVINQDLVVQGSICVGLDCTSGESFGFDTIRLKENNTRIKFEDTSVGTFPTTDWQLTANDSASGGQSRFSIEDITAVRVPFTVEAGSTTNSIYVDSTGRVGFRTSTPVLDLHVSTSNTPGLRLEQNSSGGFTAQTWDVAGNEANFFIRSATTGSQLPFRIRPGAPTSSIDIAANGDVGIGTAGPTEDLHVTGSDGGTKVLVSETNGTVATRQLLELESNGAPQFRMEDTQAGGQAWAFTVGLSAFSISNFAVAGTQFQVDNNGDIRAQGNIFSGGTQLAVPDYVFDPEYALMPIEDLQVFVETNKHLPNVPNAAAIKAGGLNHSEFQMRLLEKIEELTLYTLSLHQTVEELKADRDAKTEALTAVQVEQARLQGGGGLD